jgi:hypothetical protein
MNGFFTTVNGDPLDWESFDSEADLVDAIRRHLLTNDQNEWLFHEGLSIEDCLNGRYGGDHEENVAKLYDEWNAVIGKRVFGDAPDERADPGRRFELDCQDNSCEFHGKGRGGMRTNGGCRCLDLPFKKRMGLRQFIHDKDAELERLRMASVAAEDSEKQLHDAEARIEAALAVGHNDDCLFCGLKDKALGGGDDSHASTGRRGQELGGE